MGQLLLTKPILPDSILNDLVAQSGNSEFTKQGHQTPEMGSLPVRTQACTMNVLEASISCTLQRIQGGRYPQAWLPISFTLAQDAKNITWASWDLSALKYLWELEPSDFRSWGVWSLSSNNPRQSLAGVPGSQLS